MSTDAEQSNIVELPIPKFPPIEYGVTEAALAELAERFKDPDASTDDGYELCKDGVREMTALRMAVETRRKDLKSPALDFGREVDKQAKDIKRRIKLIEAPVREAKEAVDEIQQEIARKAAKAEQARVDAIKANIEKIAATAREQNPDDTAADYQQHMTWLTELAITDEIFGEFVDDAKTERDAALFKLGQWLERAEQREADYIRRKAEQAALDLRKKELDEIEAKQKKESDRIDKEKREADERTAAAEKLEQEKTEREERETAEAEQKRVDRIKAAIDSLATIPDRAAGISSERLDQVIVNEKVMEPTAIDFAEFLPDAMQAWKTSIETLGNMRHAASDAEEQARRDAEARLPDRDKLLRWCDALADIPEPEVLNAKAQKTLRRYTGDLAKFLERLRSDIGKL